jgi:phosphoserine phosphatase
MNYKKYSQSTWDLIKQTISNKKNTSNRLVAAFDADGTLWDCDLGENFFQYQIDHKQVPLPENPFQHYLDLKKVKNDPRSAYVWLAQINKNVPLETISNWADQAFASIKPNPIFEEQRLLIQLLIENDIDVYIVTASIKWAVEPGARALGIPIENVIGVETEVHDNKISELPVLPITYRNGKVEALKKQIGTRIPFLAVGNSIGDFELLDFSSDIKLVVSAAAMDDHLYKSEKELQAEAHKKNWIIHRFV